MKKNNFALLSCFVVGFLLYACSSTEERTLSGYKFYKESAETESFSNNEFSGNLTVDVFLMIHEYPSTWTTVVRKAESNEKNEFHLRFGADNSAQWFFGDGIAPMVLNWKPQDYIKLNQWVRVTAVRNIDLALLEIWIDGKQVSSKKFKEMPFASKTENSIVFMGQGKNTLDATVAEIRLYSKALTAQEIEKTYGAIKRPDKQEKLAGLWLFDKPEGEIVRDISGKGRDVKIKKVK